MVESPREAGPPGSLGAAGEDGGSANYCPVSNSDLRYDSRWGNGGHVCDPLPGSSLYFSTSLKKQVVYNLTKTTHAESLKSQTMRKSLQHNPAASRAPPCFTPCAGYLPGSPEAPLSNFCALSGSFSTCSGIYFHI